LLWKIVIDNTPIGTKRKRDFKEYLLNQRWRFGHGDTSQGADFDMLLTVLVENGGWEKKVFLPTVSLVNSPKFLL
jgi:hypothetical protein